MEQKFIRDFILSRSQQIVVSILLLAAFIGCSILILRRLEEERQFVKVERTSISTKKAELGTRSSELGVRSSELGVRVNIKGGENISLKPSLKSKEEIININTADKNKLMSLHGIGPKLAERILEYRNKVGSFTSIEDIMKVKGIGVKKFEKWKDKITVD